MAIGIGLSAGDGGGILGGSLDYPAGAVVYLDSYLGVVANAGFQVIGGEDVAVFLLPRVYKSSVALSQFNSDNIAITRI